MSLGVLGASLQVGSGVWGAALLSGERMVDSCGQEELGVAEDEVEEPLAIGGASSCAETRECVWLGWLSRHGGVVCDLNHLVERIRLFCYFLRSFGRLLFPDPIGFFHGTL